jgi:hypothetical protein
VGRPDAAGHGQLPDEDWRGIGDVLAALPWARMDKEFLEDLAVYMRALTRILGQVTGKNSKTAKAAATRLRQAAARSCPPAPLPGHSAGAWAVTDPNTTMSLVSKSGAQIDAESHRPLATMVAAALEVPLTMLLGDPGIRRCPCGGRDPRPADRAEVQGCAARSTRSCSATSPATSSTRP